MVREICPFDNAIAIPHRCLIDGFTRIIVGVKYCFRYNQRNRRPQHDENGEPIDMTNMPRTHRRRREKKLMTMDEVNDRFPLTKYKAWMSTRAEEGLPTAGGVAGPQSRPASINETARTIASLDDHRKSGDSADHGLSTVNNTPEKPKDNPDSTKTPQKSPEGQSGEPMPDPPLSETERPSQPAAALPPPTRTEVQQDNDMDDDDQIQIAVPTEMLANPGDSCAICIDTLEDDDDVRGLTCGHAFHASCLDPWLTNRRACCPLCKADYFIPKPRPEGESATDAERHAGRRPPGMSGARIDGPRHPQYAFLGRNGRPRMVIPTRFMSLGTSAGERDRYGFTNAQRRPRRTAHQPRQNQTASAVPADAAEGEQAQRNTWRTRFRNIRVPTPSLGNPFRRRNSPTSESDHSPEIGTSTADPTPSQLEAGQAGSAVQSH
ncbi:MAG: hypothetical protein Q9195_009036 [Heterodermia aff. obscurata]